MSVLKLDNNQTLQGMALVAPIAHARIQTVIIFANANSTTKEMVKVQRDVIIMYFLHML
jgi:hypothetical protein